MSRLISASLLLTVLCLSLFCIRSGAYAQETPPRVGVPGGGHGNVARSVATHTPPTAAELAAALDIPAGEIFSAGLGTSDGQGTAVFVAPAHGFPLEGGSYAVLSTGHALDAFLPNDDGSLSTELNGLNNSQGNDLVQLSLTLAVPVGASEWAVDFKFLSEEFPEFVGSIYNDAFFIETPISTFAITGAEIDAPNNVALDPDGRMVTINSVGPGGMTTANALGTTYDGATGKLTAVAPLPIGATEITIIFSVTDLGDSIYDTTVFLDNFHFILGTTVDYTPSIDNFPNPERGFYRHTETHSTGYMPLTETALQGYRSENISLILRLFYLDDFTATPISQSYLDAMETDFDRVRAAGLKAVVRFAYTNETGATWPPAPPYGDANKGQILGHLTQLRPLLYKHRDVIAVVQAGFIGIWGEWYYTELTDIGERREVLQEILAALPVERMVQVRTPGYKQQIYGTGTGAAAALLASDAHNTSNIARTGHHNDCFLASETDYGTYNDIAQDKAYLAEESKYLPVGGETCNDTTDDDDPLTPVNESSDRSLCPTALTELADFHWSYLNWDYHPDVRSGWSVGGCLDDIKRKLGYRLTLLQGDYDNAVKPGGEFTINLALHNDGWAAPFNPRLVEILLRNQVSGAIYKAPLPDDPRTWLADGGGQYTINRTICAPSTMPTGSYDLLLNFPDPELALYSRPEYAIRLANNGIWEAATGYNNLGHTILVNPNASSAICTTPLVLRQLGTNATRVIRFAGRDWEVKSGSGLGPGPNDWSNDERSVWVDDAGRLHLKIRQIGDIWHSAEVTTLEYTQEGLHRFYLTTPDVTPENTPRLLNNGDKRVIVAPFVYAADNLEVDMEFTRWGEEAPGYDAQYAIQPEPYITRPDPDTSGNLHRFLMALSGRDSTHEFDWSNTGATFKSFSGHTTDPAAQIQEKTLTGGNVPNTNNNLKIHINLWLNQWLYLFELQTSFVGDLDADVVSSALRDRFAENDIVLSAGAIVTEKEAGEGWTIEDGIERYRITNGGGWLNVFRRRWNPPSDGRPAEIIVSNLDAPQGNNTPWGTAVAVSLPGVELIFPSITQPGKTTLTTSGVGPPLANFQIPGNPPIYYDIHTTALFQPPVEVCVEYDPDAFVNEAGLGLYHYNGTNWENITLPGYPDPGSRVICGATDFFSTFAVLESTDQPPTADAGGPYSGDEGSAITLSGATAADPDGDILIYAWEVGSPSLCSFDDASLLNPNLTCTDNGNFSVEFTVSDGVNDLVSDTATVTVNNVAPTITLSGATDVDEGAPYLLTLGNVHDPGQDTVTQYAVDWGDTTSDTFTADELATSNRSVTHIYDDGPDAHIISIDLIDEDGAFLAVETMDIAVKNVAPTMTLELSEAIVNEGSPVDLSAVESDDRSPGDRSAGFTYAFDCGDNTGYGDFDTAISISCPTAGAAGWRRVGAQIRDKDGGIGAYTADVYVKPSREVKASLRDALLTTLPTADKQDQKEIGKAIDDLHKSLDDKFWETDSRLTKKGNKVFDEEKSAVKALQKVVGLDVLSIIAGLVEVDRVLAIVQIADAEAAGGASKYLAKAYERMAKAQEELDAGDFDKAIDNYKKAWEYARKAEGKPVEAASVDSSDEFEMLYQLFLPMNSN